MNERLRAFIKANGYGKDFFAHISSAKKPFILNQKGGAIKSGKDKARTSARRESKACLRRGITD